MTTPPRRPSLAGAFGAKTPPDRAEGLRGLLPPRQESATAPTAPTITPPGDAGVPPAGAAPVRRAERTTRAKTAAPTSQPSSAHDEDTVNMPAYLPPKLLEWLRDETRARDATYADVLFDAFEAVDAAQLLEAFTPHALTGAGGVPRRAAKIRGDGGFQRQFRVSRAQREWVDARVIEVGAPSRSALCAVALERYRTHLERMPR